MQTTLTTRLYILHMLKNGHFETVRNLLKALDLR